MIRSVLIVAGSFFLGMGILGIFVPLLPTTPFLLLAAACYARSSGRFYFWLIRNPYFGKYISNYREGKGIPMKVKILSISIMWISILISVFLIEYPIFVKILLVLIASGVSYHILSIQTRVD